MNDIQIGKNETAAVELDPRFSNRQGTIETMIRQTRLSAGDLRGPQVLREVPGGIFTGKR